MFIKINDCSQNKFRLNLVRMPILGKGLYCFFCKGIAAMDVKFISLVIIFKEKNIGSPCAESFLKYMIIKLLVKYLIWHVENSSSSNNTVEPLLQFFQSDITVPK